jgi:hypothetical protein
MAYGNVKSYSFNPFAKRFWLQSLVLHALLLLAAFLFGSYAVSQETARSNTVKVAQSIDRTERAQKQKVEKKVADSSERLQQIETRMRKLSGEKDPEPAAKPEIEDPKKKLEQALEKARKSLEKIEKLEQKAKAAELAKLLKIPVEQALKRLPPPPPKLPESLLPLTDKQIADKVADYEKQAKRILDGQEQKEMKKAEGTPVAQNQADKSNKKPQAGAAASSDRTVKMAKDSQSSGAARGASQSTGGVGATGSGAGLGGVVAGKTLGDPGVGDGRVESLGVGEPNRVYEGTSTTQKLAKESVRGFDGRIIGAGAEFTNRIYLNAWYVIGPFAVSNAANQEALPPESGVDLDAAYFGKGRQLLQWQYHETKSYPYVPLGAEGDAVYYGYTEIMLDQDRVLIADIGSDDDAKVWVNDTLVWSGNNEQKPWYRNGGYRPLQHERETYNLTEGSIKLNLKKGRNKILFRLFNGYADTFFSMVLSPVK